jgi:hypothetical protein
LLLTIALALTLTAEPDAGLDEAPEEGPRWQELGEGDGGVDAPSISGSAKLSTALTVKQVSRSGGTMHFAEKTVISCGRCGAPLVLKREQAPLIDHVLDLGGRRYLLLGWSSGGNGFQSVQVLLVAVGPQGPQLIDELDWFSSRSDRGVLLASTPQGWRIGFPQPPSQDDDFFDANLRVASGKSRHAADLEKSGFFQPVPAGLVAFAYCPPFGEGIRLRGNAGWLRVTATGFKAP